ncbi:hypothetical protein OQA88_12944 [Cercophora sp. LCS_1]
MTASPFLLEFLYPSGAASFLKRLRPTFTPCPELGQSSRTIAARPFSSASDTGEADAASVPGVEQASDAQGVSREGEEENTDFSEYIQNRAEGSDPALLVVTHPELGDIITSGQSSNVLLQRLLDSPRGGSYEQVWTEYTALDSGEQVEFRDRVIVHLAKSRRQVDIERVTELFSGLDLDQWTPASVSAAVLARLLSKDVSSALHIHKQAVSETGITSGLDPLLAYALALDYWDLATRLLGDDMSHWQQLPQFILLSRLPEFHRKLSGLDRFSGEIEDGETRDKLKSQTGAVLKMIARTSVSLFRPSDAEIILDRAQDRLAYETHILDCAEKELWDQVGPLYRRYRKLPSPSISEALLRAALYAFALDNNIRGLEEVAVDWYRAHGHMDTGAYKTMATHYARRGDIGGVARMTYEWAKWYPESIEEDPQKWVSIQMNVHAVRGNPREAARIMNEAVERWGPQPDPIHWNILLKAYAKADDYESAVETLLRLCEEAKPDSYSFSGVMQMVSARGDLSLTLELYKFAIEKGVEPSASMVGCVVEAYCQNDRFPEAERLCKIVTETKSITGEYSHLWNILLRHYGNRRDLDKVNGVLDVMTEHKVPYDSFTYGYLLTALVNCRQSHHALHFLNISTEQNVFKPTQHHYLILMAAFIESNEPHHVIKIKQKMDELGFEKTPNQVAKLMKALGKWSRMPSYKKTGDAGQQFLAWTMKEFSRTIHNQPPQTVSEFKNTTNMYSQLMFVLTQFRDFASVEQLMKLYQLQFPSKGNTETIPLKLLHNIMLADFYEKKHDRVEAIFDLILDRLIRTNKAGKAGLNDEGPRRVLRGLRFSITEPLKTMQRLYLAQSNPQALMALIARVRNNGFELDSKNWNLHVQALATLKQWREAFAVCEEQLMPQWTGWQQLRVRTPGVKSSLPLDVRRLGSNPHRPRPISYTLIILAREYMELEQMTLWSNEADQLFKAINRDYPKTVHAVTTMVRTYSDQEERIFTSTGVPDLYETNKLEIEVDKLDTAQKLAKITEQKKAVPGEAMLAPGPGEFGTGPVEIGDSDSASASGARDYAPRTMLKVPKDCKEEVSLEDFLVKRRRGPEPVVRKVQPVLYSHERRTRKAAQAKKRELNLFAEFTQSPHGLPVGVKRSEDPFSKLEEKAVNPHKKGAGKPVTEW